MINPKLIMTLLVRDEEDIVRKNIDFHLNNGVDFIIATDNASTDGTRNILKEYEERGVLHLIDEKEQDHSQSKWVNRMGRIAYEKYKADIIFHCDADEFWYPKNGNLKTEMWNSSESVVYVDLAHVLLTQNEGLEIFPNDTRWAVIKPLETSNLREDSKKNNFYFFRNPPRVIFKTKNGLLDVTEGNHDIKNINSKKKVFSDNIIIYHFPLRGKKHFFDKVKKSGSALLENKHITEDIGWHWRRWYKSFMEGELDKDYGNLVVTEEVVEKMKSLEMVEDINPKYLFDNMIQCGYRYNNPKFEYEEKFQDAAWPWVGHKFFAYDLVANLKPNRIVELGTHYGTSFWSFSQAVKDNFLETELNSIDTWEGEKHAGFYGEEVLETVKQIRNKYYSDLKINLIKKTFEDALTDFENNSIDILHIDGLHTYEAVRHDFESWLPKIKSSGIILFHDIEVGEKDFGVHKLWEELKKQYKTIEFYHSFGLGVLFLDEKIGSEFLLKQKEFELHYSYIHEMNRSYFIHNQTQKNDDLNRELNLVKSSVFWRLRNACVDVKKFFVK